MNDRRMGDLVRMAMEVEELERDASAGAGAPKLRLVGGGDGAWRSHSEPSRAWWIGMSVAAAAVLAMAAALPLMMGPPAVQPGPMVAERSDPTPAVVEPGVEREPSVTHLVATPPVDLGAIEKCVVLAIYRDQRGSMRCVDVKPQEWQGNKCLSEVTAQEMKTVSLDRPCTPEADHALVVAMSGPQRALPKTKADAEGLATCILGSPSVGYEDLRRFTSAATGCVSPEVAVKIEAIGTH